MNIISKTKYLKKEKNATIMKNTKIIKRKEAQKYFHKEYFILQ